MTTYEANNITLERVREHVWKMPREGDMRVPAIVLASKPLLDEIAGDRTLEQLKNTTHLPGIQKHAICMPDGHQGYGFPVGGVAGIDAETGCISPGAVGYDINCLTGDSEVRLSFGRRMPIRDLRERFEEEHAIVAGDDLVASEIKLFTESHAQPVYEVVTRTGQRVRATEDHPFLTPEGMVELKALREGDRVYVSPFEGVRHEDPAEFIVLDEDDFADADPGLLERMNRNDLLPLKSTDDAFNRLLLLMAYHTGAGSFSGTQTVFYGDPGDLAVIREDIRALGYTPSRVYSRERELPPHDREITRIKHRVTVDAPGFKHLLLGLGVPEGNPVESDFGVPDWFERLARWQQALYLSAFFGAEMDAPDPRAAVGHSCPTIAQRRRTRMADAGEEFMVEIARALGSMGITTTNVERVDAEGEPAVCVQFGIENDPENLIRFFSHVGFQYNRDKQRNAALAIQYLRLKERVIDRQDAVAASTLTDGGTTGSTVNAQDNAGLFIDGERSRGDPRIGRPRLSSEFPTFEAYCDSTPVRRNLTVPVAIEAIIPVGTERVYDIGVTHDAHNFVANGIVVSNCGVRMMKTNLSYEDLEGREEELVDALFERIPLGLGAGGVIQGDVSTVEDILEHGMAWALDEGYAVEDDLEHCEDEGSRPESDAVKVSKKAKERGKGQIGSLGSGNHFLEVQRVTDVFDEDVADRFGLTRGQIVVMIHCGSRGLGHQTCTDYLRKIEKTHAGLLNQLPDKELAAAPAGSQLADDYYHAMGGAINYAWVNRQLVMHGTREVFEEVFGESWEALGMELLYDVAHNIAKKEHHTVDGEDRALYVHRKGATRAFPAGRPEVPAAYSDVGQPVIIPGSMGSGSYVLRGGSRAMELTFGSTAHGAGRVMSRTQAKKTFWGGDVQRDLQEQQRVYVKAQSGATIAEEAPGVYKDIDEVVRVSDSLGIGDKVARTYPVVNIKG